MNRFLADAVFWICVVACAVSQIGILRATVAARRHGASPAKSGLIHRPATALEELAWAVLPVVALAAALVLTWRAIHPVLPALGGAA